MTGACHGENGSGEKGSQGSEAGRGGAGVGQVVDLEVCEAAAEGGDGNEDLGAGFDGVGGRWVVGPGIMHVVGLDDEGACAIDDVMDKRYATDFAEPLVAVADTVDEAGWVVRPEEACGFGRGAGGDDGRVLVVGEQRESDPGYRVGYELCATAHAASDGDVGQRAAEQVWLALLGGGGLYAPMGSDVEETVGVLRGSRYVVGIRRTIPCSVGRRAFGEPDVECERISDFGG